MRREKRILGTHARVRMCVCVRAYNCFWLDCEGEAWHIHFPHGTHFWQHIKYIQHEFMYVWVSKEGRKRRAMVLWIEWALADTVSKSRKCHSIWPNMIFYFNTCADLYGWCFVCVHVFLFLLLLFYSCILHVGT